MFAENSIAKKNSKRKKILRKRKFYEMNAPKKIKTFEKLVKNFLFHSFSEKNSINLNFMEV